MNELKSFVKKIRKVKSVALFTHLNPDGDALGSVFSMKAILAQAGINARIYLEKEMPQKFSYLGDDYVVGEPDGVLAEDCAFALDCGAFARLGTLSSLFKTAKTSFCLDHHYTQDSFADVSFVVPKAAATCELCYYFSKEILNDIPYEALCGIYTGISTDTGHFKYSNTSPDTLKIAADIIERGLDFRLITTILYDTVKLSKLKFWGEIASRIKVFDNNIAVLFAQKEFLEEFNLSYEDLEELPNMVSNLEGINVGVLVKSAETEGMYKLSFRGHDQIDLSALASFFGGGGHKNAAACVIKEPMETALPKIIEKINQMLKD